MFETKMDNKNGSEEGMENMSLLGNYSIHEVAWYYLKAYSH